MRFLPSHQLIIQVRLHGEFGVTGENEIMSAICCASAAAANNFNLFFLTFPASTEVKKAPKKFLHMSRKVSMLGIFSSM
jgi:hypothetical protein